MGHLPLIITEVHKFSKNFDYDVRSGILFENSNNHAVHFGRSSMRKDFLEPNLKAYFRAHKISDTLNIFKKNIKKLVPEFSESCNLRQPKLLG